jgi:hypothetical protein
MSRKIKNRTKRKQMKKRGYTKKNIYAKIYREIYGGTSPEKLDKIEFDPTIFDNIVKSTLKDPIINQNESSLSHSMPPPPPQHKLWEEDADDEYINDLIKREDEIQNLKQEKEILKEKLKKMIKLSMILENNYRV